jgi:ATP-binding cassette subfamily F protein uup
LRISPNRNRAPQPAEAVKPARAKAAGKLSWKEARELDELPQRIAVLEAEQKRLGERLADPALYQSASSEAAQVSARLNEIDEELLALLERWEALETMRAG